MKYVFGFFLLIIFYSSISANEYKYTKIIKLKKDQSKKILVKYEKQEKLFKFRWTLFANGGLVVLRSYDRTVAQNMLYLRRKNQSFRLYLKPKGNDFSKSPYILMKFEKFNYETNEVTFILHLSDKNSEIYLEYLKDK